MNIVLIGMPGAGKSTIGVILAKALGMNFIDTDILIQQAEGRLLQDIIDTRGIEEFIKLEENAILDIGVGNCVIATGGSAVYSTAAVRHLKKEGIFVYLKLPYDVIAKRIKNVTTRGIVMNKGQNLMDLFEDRTPLYEKYADITVDCIGKDMEAIVSEIKYRLNNI